MIANSTIWSPTSKLVRKWLAVRHAVYHRTNGPMTNFASGSQLAELEPTGRKLEKNWTNWIGNARYGCHRTIGPMIQFRQLVAIGGLVANWRKYAKSDDIVGEGMAVTPNAGSALQGGIDCRGPWGFRIRAGFIIGRGKSRFQKFSVTPLINNNYARFLAPSGLAALET